MQLNTPDPPGWRVTVANLNGSLSIACWIIVLLPQLLEQWRLKSADGISISFITIWLVGDICNLVGALMAGLRPSVTLLAVWFCISDSLLMLSYFYYTRQERRRRPPISSAATSDSTPLLQDLDDVTAELTGSRPRSKSRLTHNWLIEWGLPILFVAAVTVISYSYSQSSRPGGDGSGVKNDGPVPQTLGYASALLYLTARVPQIVRNHHRRSVVGLSVVFFCLSITGNASYAAQILFYRTDWPWIKAYIPWLLGSLGTIVQDLIILIQFHLYEPKEPERSL